ncbi:MAG: SDR family oxidoreductase [Rhizobiaceae bacterium]|nr:SDR family oxidoreductase [Rhizobiaceae bacterium]
MTTSPDLSNQTAIVTGASRGIGEATARYLAGLGAHVILAARSEDTIEKITYEITKAGGKATALKVDTSSSEDVKAMINCATDKTGRLDLLINNAGIIDPISRITESDPDAWGRALDVNVKGVYYGLRYALPEMTKQRSGTIVNISSGAANSFLEGWSHYCASKAAVVRLTGIAHKEAEADGVRVFGLSPGTVATGMMQQIKASGINQVSQLPWDAHITPDWVAKAIAFLTTAGADKWRGTDFSLKVDEGREAIGMPLES